MPQEVPIGVPQNWLQECRLSQLESSLGLGPRLPHCLVPVHRWHATQSLKALLLTEEPTLLLRLDLPPFFDPVSQQHHQRGTCPLWDRPPAV